MGEKKNNRKTRRQRHKQQHLYVQTIWATVNVKTKWTSLISGDTMWVSTWMELCLLFTVFSIYNNSHSGQDCVGPVLSFIFLKPQQVWAS